mmetsp:Transcript_47782/g.55032  ORF Transcript_47782/g.55032 Transcript_47782/m.55032 type:complete len:408 (-) Transcript_47782:574-1797(-)|eukprot:CAMPEP_0115008650 /NCGR_PEP_ID=MMETSP0216-20121206/22073_1 /TAXON_ID=223996 /ORGANISM="Protocruzia adherens, Strain Boccale" /LENGTH=407 /DNA_ID=CAMNT_0002376167 /DNA_START=135 /DNA_END=1358 /DNA_ORIENTATION=+
MEARVALKPELSRGDGITLKILSREGIFLKEDYRVLEPDIAQLSMEQKNKLVTGDGETPSWISSWSRELYEELCENFRLYKHYFTPLLKREAFFEIWEAIIDLFLGGPRYEVITCDSEPAQIEKYAQTLKDPSKRQLFSEYLTAVKNKWDSARKDIWKAIYLPYRYLRRHPKSTVAVMLAVVGFLGNSSIPGLAKVSPYALQYLREVQDPGAVVRWIVENPTKFGVGCVIIATAMLAIDYATFLMSIPSSRELKDEIKQIEERFEKIIRGVNFSSKIPDVVAEVNSLLDDLTKIANQVQEILDGLRNKQLRGFGFAIGTGITGLLVKGPIGIALGVGAGVGCLIGVHASVKMNSYEDVMREVERVTTKIKKWKEDLRESNTNALDNKSLHEAILEKLGLPRPASDEA